MDVPDTEIAKKRAEVEAKIAQAESELESKFPAQDEPIVWEVVNADDFESSGGAILSRLPDNSLLASGRNAGTDTYTVKATINAKEVTQIRLEALTHPSLAKNGPGRVGADGNGKTALSICQSRRNPRLGCLFLILIVLLIVISYVRWEGRRCFLCGLGELCVRRLRAF